MPAGLSYRSGSPLRPVELPPIACTPSPQWRRGSSSSDFSFDEEEEDAYCHEDDDDEASSWNSATARAKVAHQPYKPDPKDPLDVEVARIVNASPIAIKCQKGPPGTGRYYFGNELSPSVGGGKKLYTCKLMNYAARGESRRGDRAARNKVLVRVGGGWQDLELFLLHYGILH